MGTHDAISEKKIPGNKFWNYPAILKITSDIRDIFITTITLGPFLNIVNYLTKKLMNSTIAINMTAVLMLNICIYVIKSLT